MDGDRPSVQELEERVKELERRLEFSERFAEQLCVVLALAVRATKAQPMTPDEKFIVVALQENDLPGALKALGRMLAESMSRSDMAG